MKFPQVLQIFFLSAAALGTEAGLLALANWQNHRYHQRLDEQAAFSARPTVTLTGTFLPSATFALTNQPNPTNPEADLGWRILTPLQTASGTLIVDRGYTPPLLNPEGTPNFTSVRSATCPPEILKPCNPVILEGILLPIPQRHGWLHGPDTTTNPHLLTFLNPALITSQTQVTYLIARTSTSPNLTNVPPPLPAPTRHLSYALQWLGMALAFPVLCLVSFLKSRRKK